MSDTPLVSCICPTLPTRREWLPLMLRFYINQDYTNKELVIVTDDHVEAEYVAHLTDVIFNLRPACRIVVHPGNVGTKRNAACEHSLGELICHFDDDDASAPTRISDEVHRLTSSGLSVTGYNIIKFTDGYHWWQYKGAYPVGSSLLYKHSWWKTHQFDNVHVQEDNYFVTRALTFKQVITTDAMDQMFATIHGSGLDCNTSPRDVPRTPHTNWKLLSRDWKPDLASREGVLNILRQEALRSTAHVM